MTLHQWASSLAECLALHNDTQRWAFHLALMERLAAYGSAGCAYCFQREDGRADLAIWLEGQWFSCAASTPFLPTTHHGRYLTLDTGDTLVNAATWNGIDKNTLLSDVARLQQVIGQSLHYTLKDPLFAPGNSTLLLRLKSMQDDNVNIRQIYYHETELDNTASILANGFHLSSPVARLRETHLPDGVFMKRHRETLDIAHTPINIPVFLREVPVTTFADREHVEGATQTLTSYHSALADIAAINANYDKQCDNLLKQENTPENRAKYDAVLQSWKAAIHPLAAKARSELAHHFLSEKKPVLHIQCDAGSHGRTVETFLALNPKDVIVGPSAYQPKTILTLLPDVREQVKQFDQLNEALHRKDDTLTSTQWVKLHAERLGLPLNVIDHAYLHPEQVFKIAFDYIEQHITQPAAPSPKTLVTDQPPSNQNRTMPTLRARP